MRTLIAALQLFCLLLFLFAPLIGCSGNGGRKTAERISDEEARELGMVQDPTTGSWSYPPDSGTSQPYDTNDEGYEDGAGYGDDGYGDEDSADTSADDAESDDGYGDTTEQTSATTSSSDDGYGNDPYADGYGDDAYAEQPGRQDPYANSGGGYEDEYARGRPERGGPGGGPRGGGPRGGGNDGYEDGYGDDAYAASDYGDGAADPYASSEGGGGTGVFAEQIAPIFRQKCNRCHGSGRGEPKGDLELHTVAAVRGSGTITPNQPDDSELFYRITMGPNERGRMPPQGPTLTAEEIDTIRAWIQSGASYGDSGGGDGYGEAYASGGGRGGRGGRDDGYGDDPYDDDPYGEGDSERQVAAPPKNLAEAASVSFQRGDDVLAMNQLFAQSLLADSDVSKAVLSNYRYVPGLRRTKLAVRWGIGVKYNPKDGWEGSPRPAGYEQDLPGDDNRNDSGGGGDDDSLPIDFRNATLAYYGGDIGEELILRLQNRVRAGYYGPTLKTEIEKRKRGAGNDEFDEDYDDYNSGRPQSSGYDGYGGGRGGSSSDDEKPDGDLIEQLMPGVTVVGVGSNAELMTRAKQQGLDLLLVLDVVADPDRRLRIVNNSTRVRLYDTVSGDQVAISGTMKNVELQKAGSDSKIIIDEIDKVFKVADEKYQVKEFPEGSSDKIKAGVIRFVQTLLQQDSDNPLWKLSEVKFYHDRGLLKDTHMAAAYKRIAPQMADKLASISDEDELRILLADWLKAKAASPGSDRDEDSEDGEGDRSREPTFR